MSGEVVVLGGSGYIGQAFVRALRERKQPAKVLARKELDYTRYANLVRFLQETRPSFLINAAGYTGKPNVDACEEAKADTLAGNTLLPQTVVHACLATGTAWGHISSGCIYNGAKVCADGGLWRVETDLSAPRWKDLARTNPEAIHGFIETDEPNFSFRRPPCSFYSGSKALAEETLAGLDHCYIWRLRIPFDEIDNPRNYLTKIQRYAKVYDNVNSISHRADFVHACLDLWQRQAPFGTYNITNPGLITTRQVVELIEKVLQPKRRFQFWTDDAEFYRLAAKTPRSNCVLDVSKLLSTGVKMRPVAEALEASLQNWSAASP
jgi:dTDP-4-dehydrorhamnose reductase